MRDRELLANSRFDSRTRSGKANARIKVFTYPRSSTFKFTPRRVDPYSHRAMIANDCTQSCTKDENPPPPVADHVRRPARSERVTYG